MLVACNENPQENKFSNQEVNNELLDAETEKKEIFALEKSLDNTGNNPRSKKDTRKLISLSVKYANNYPGDEHSPDFLFMAARSENGLREYRKSIKLLNRVIKDYDAYDRLVEVYFLKAFTYDEDLDDKAKAKRAYTELIKRFPDNPLATESKILIDNLYLSDEELIKKYNTQD
jgi:tetratricopeptide (TPR) repeat protein